MLHREGPQRTSAGVRLFRGRAWPAHDGQPTHAREARRIAANIARLPTPLGRPAVRSQRILTRRDRRSSLGHLQRGRLRYLRTKHQLCLDRVERFHFPLSVIEMVRDESQNLDETALDQSQCRGEMALDESRS